MSALAQDLADRIDVADRLEILDLLGHYLFAVDTGDAARLIACFMRDGAVVYDTGETYRGAEELRRFAEKAIGGEEIRGRMHLNYPLFFEREGDAVVINSYVSTAQWRLPEPPKAFGSLRFVQDHCVRMPEGWRIALRKIHLWNDQTARRFGPA